MHSQCANKNTLANDPPPRRLNRIFQQIRVWKITSAKVEAESQMPNRTTHVRFSPDGKALAAGMVGGQVRFLTSDSLQPIAQVCYEWMGLSICI